MAQTGRESASVTLRPNEQIGIRRTGRSPLNAQHLASVDSSTVTCARNARTPSRARTRGTRRPPRSKDAGRGGGANDVGALVRCGDDGVLVVARAHAAV